MAVREIKFFSFKNLSVGKKLTAGFLSVVAVAIIITIVGVSGFNNIKENLRLQRLTMEMVVDLGDARLNRTLLQYTGDLDYAKKNMIAVDHLRDKLQVLSGTDLGEEGNRTRDIASKVFVRYIAALADFSRSQEELQKTTAAADIYSLERARDKLDRAQRENALMADTEHNMMLLEKDITSVISAAHVFMSRPDMLGYNDVISALNRLDSTLSELKTTGGHPLEALSNELSARIASMRPHLISCLNAATEEENRSKTLTKVSAEFRTSITDIFIYQQAKSSETVARARLQMILAASAGMVFALLTALWITRSITLPLRATLDAAKFISSGDLTHSISTDRTDEPGLLMQAVGIMNENLRQIIINVREGVGNVTRASAEIAAGNTDLSSRTEQQSAAVVETAASLEELSSTVRQTAGNAQEASRLAQDASRNAGEGGVIVGQVITTMKEIADSSLRISDIIGVINGIAFQTNILALNAAVEAARAGEHGRGFAVVAGEVRSLSQRSSTAAKEIEQLIQESGEKIANGSMLVNRAGDAMTGIVSSVLKVREIMAEIATASGEQSSGIEQINQAMSEMDTTTQQNAALVEESAASAEALDEHARSLEAKLSVFRLEKES